MFIWRLAHNSLPVKSNVARRGVLLDTICPMCKRLDEDCGHLFFKCKYVKKCWRLMNLEGARVELMKCQSGKETIQKLWELDKTIQLNVVVLLWRWWSARNKVNDGGRMQSEAEIQSSVTFFSMEKAYDKIPRNVMWWALDKHKVPTKYVGLIKDMYNNVVTSVQISDGDTDDFSIRIGLY